VKHKRMIWFAFSCVIVLTLACNLPGQVAKNVGKQIEERIEDQLQEALEATGIEELTEDLKGISEQFTGHDLGDLIDNFSSENWSREDIPLPPDADIVAGYSGEAEGDFVLLETSMGIDEAEAWMIARLEEHGWHQGEMDIQMDLAQVFNFSKGDENLGLVLNRSLSGNGTNISITVYH
jgi:hypothetical protein